MSFDRPVGASRDAGRRHLGRGSWARSRAGLADTANAPDDPHPRANPKVSTAIRLDAHMEPEPDIAGNRIRALYLIRSAFKTEKLSR